MMSELAVGWLLLDAAIIAERVGEKATGDEKAFYEGKKFSALWYARNVLPNVEQAARMMAVEDTSSVEISNNAFGSI
jgi:hypothetical protein